MFDDIVNLSDSEAAVVTHTHNWLWVTTIFILEAMRRSEHDGPGDEDTATDVRRVGITRGQFIRV
eukprot:scaffold63188_cov36-Prasinocladus_malaysianus.AAC.1